MRTLLGQRSSLPKCQYWDVNLAGASGDNCVAIISLMDPLAILSSVQVFTNPSREEDDWSDEMYDEDV